MKAYQVHVFFIVTSVCTASNCLGQNFSAKFSFNTIFENDSAKWIRPTIDSVEKPFYIDSLYEVRKTCSGEWGGSVHFKNRVSKRETSCEVICPVVVNRIDNKYYVTATLSHRGVGSSEVIEIENPDDMEVFKLPKSKSNFWQRLKRIQVYNIGDTESKSKKGTRTIVDSVGVLTLYSLVIHNELYHIVTNADSLMLCNVENGHFITQITLGADIFSTYSFIAIEKSVNNLTLYYMNKDYVTKKPIEGTISFKGYNVTHTKYE